MANASLHDQRITRPSRHINPGFHKVDAAAKDAMSILNRHSELPGHELVDQLITAGHYPDASLYAIDRLVTIGECTAHLLPDDSPLAKPNLDAGAFLVRLAKSQSTPFDDTDWPTVSEAAREQGVECSVITKAANSGALATNGKTGRDRRIDPASLVKWNLQRAGRE